MIAKDARVIVGCIKFAMLALFVAIVLVWVRAARAECPAWACPGSQTRNITIPSDTGIVNRIVGDLYQPFPGARIQVREHSDTGIGSRIRAYIEPDGTITDPDTRQEIGRIDGLFND